MELQQVLDRMIAVGYTTNTPISPTTYPYLTTYRSVDVTNSLKMLIVHSQLSSTTRWMEEEEEGSSHDTDLPFSIQHFVWTAISCVDQLLKEDLFQLEHNNGPFVITSNVFAGIQCTVIMTYAVLKEQGCCCGCDQLDDKQCANAIDRFQLTELDHAVM